MGAASNYLGRVVEGYAGSVYRTLGSVFRHVALVPGDVQVFCASDTPGRLSEDPAELMRRYRASRLAEHSLPVGAFETMLPAEDVAFVRGQLEQAQAQGKLPLNTDARPVTYYLNMLLWGKQSASGLRGVAGAAAAAGALALSGAGPAAGGAGSGPLVARGAAGRDPDAAGRGLRPGHPGARSPWPGELALLFSFQAQVGLVFERVALLSGLFMTGLALGGGLARPLATGRWGLMAAGTDPGADRPGARPAASRRSARWPIWATGRQQTGYLGLSLALGLAVRGRVHPVPGPDQGGAAGLDRARHWAAAASRWRQTTWAGPWAGWWPGP